MDIRYFIDGIFADSDIGVDAFYLDGHCFVFRDVELPGLIPLSCNLLN